MTPRIVTRRIITVAVLLAAVAAPAQLLAQAAQGKQAKQEGGATLHGFSISLVIGDLQAATAADTVPAAARRALNDMKDFLPYKSYRLVDTAWILGTASNRMSTTRLGGPANEQYAVTLIPKSSPPGDLQINFNLRQSEAVDDGARRASLVSQEMAELKTTRATLEAALAKLKEQSGERQSELARTQDRLLNANQRIAALEAGAPPTARTITLIDTTFAMDIGETVVVGTSRVQGDKALIALLTAVPRTTK